MSHGWKYNKIQIKRHPLYQNIKCSNSNIIKILEIAGIKTITIAPETGSENLRFSVDKKITNKKIISVLKLIKDSKIRNVKIYFLIGLPEETEDDINNIVS